MKLRLTAVAFCCASFFSYGQVTSAQITELSKMSKVPEQYVAAALADVAVLSSVQEKIVKPWEAKPWHQYKKIFLTDTRLAAAKQFMQQHAELLNKAEKQFGVNKEVIVAIIAVETNFGQNMGKDRVIDALYTLGYHYPAAKTDRSPFFKKELAAYIELSHQENWQANSRMGSYAGAMGYGQFMPSSYQHYAVDFDGDGKRDLFGNIADAIGSVANYFKAHKWRLNQPVVDTALIIQQSALALVNKDLKTKYSLADLNAKGVGVAKDMKYNEQANLFMLDEEAGPEHYLGYHNFFVITRYNRSHLYAMVVHQLSQAVKRGHY